MEKGPTQHNVLLLLLLLLLFVCVVLFVLTALASHTCACTPMLLWVRAPHCDHPLVFLLLLLQKGNPEAFLFFISIF